MPMEIRIAQGNHRFTGRGTVSTIEWKVQSGLGRGGDALSINTFQIVILVAFIPLIESCFHILL
jgi:hypothetical protein